MTESTTLLGALAKALPELEAAKKNAANPHFRSKYADLGSVIEAICPIAAHGLWFRQVSHERDNGVAIETIYIHESGELSAGIVFVPADKNNAQGFGSAMTYCRRYSLQAAFGLATEDDDGNAAAANPPRGAAQGHSQTGAVSSDGSKPREKLSGPYTSRSTLQTEVKSFVHTMNGIADWDEWCAYRDTKEVVALLEQVRRDIPEWWEGGPSMPDEFVPLHRQIEVHEANLAQHIADIARV